MLLFAISVEAQTIADIARKERERKANLKSVRVITAEDVKSAVSTTPGTPEAAKPADAPKPASPPAPAAPAPPAPSKSDAAAKKYADDLAKLRAKVIQLQDQETALQLQINDFKSQFLSPVSDTNSRAQAQTKMEQAQTQLTSTQKELADTKRQVQVMEAQGPPKG